MIVLGLDGLDPGPDDSGGSTRAACRPSASSSNRAAISGRSAPSLPPQTPVAWSNFITGMDPGGHAIFDFFNRDPKTYVPVFSATETLGRAEDRPHRQDRHPPIGRPGPQPAQGPGLLADPRGARASRPRSSRCPPTTRRSSRSSGRSPA
ncbi:MAG: alkaline phosphatase family protein [Candidatus Moduliflexus flocculans]|nr:alkaline phosphatase family protein [Candidatus Moduliflexus flocculans]